METPTIETIKQWLAADPNTLNLEQMRYVVSYQRSQLLKAQPGVTVDKLTLKVSEKGAVSVYGMGRFPVTLYKEQWLRLLADTQVAAMKAFIADHNAELRDGLTAEEKAEKAAKYKAEAAAAKAAK